MPDRLNRHDLSDEEWERLRVLLPSGPQQRGGRWADHRTVINGIFFRTRAGCPWRDLPEGFGNWKTIYNRHRRWSLDGTWEQILDGPPLRYAAMQGNDRYSDTGARRRPVSVSGVVCRDDRSRLRCGADPKPKPGHMARWDSCHRDTRLRRAWSA